MSVPTFKTSFGVAGRFKLTVRKASDLSIVRASCWTDNIVTRAGLNAMAGNSLGFGCVVGTGNTPADFEDTSLVSFLAGQYSKESSSSLPTVVTTPKRYSMSWAVWRFAAGAAAGNISEVGISMAGASSSSTLYARALVVDALGNPTTITVLSDEILDVRYEMYKYAPTADITGNTTFTIDGVPIVHSYTIRPSRSSGFGDGWIQQVETQITKGDGLFGATTPGCGVINGTTLAAPFGKPTGTNIGGIGGPITNDVYVENSFSRELTMVVDLNDGNFAAGFNILNVSFRGVAWQILISPPIAKVNTKRFTFKMKTAWASGEAP